MTTLHVPVAIGEVVDKITILEIKEERIADPAKLKNIKLELSMLREVLAKEIGENADMAKLHAKLKGINEDLWQIEDDIRDKERAKSFDEEFIRLARAVYVTNDQRMLAKREINDLFGSTLVEEKSYAAY
ncbi:MAG TPA: hypothetical protein DFI00_02620 [Rhodospirillaceae bacterium]|nr:hypothetical protein [Alphaproteobacteria bacterium]OUT42046.1 MAG: hypothetical protein CBB62_07020 [Micavibrio sp. TMED2]HCI46167.1 hypothetical protein [Rhodospirillaceae bacterium]MAS46347.1 hypothetical protein [Alphaproteobacteria bacterium]MAX95468.1 hypothetical protein [Alphaproteobacteria bacterium]|tara:strand:+ start:7798 stop:8187 length:390 start_codon:yes stop_codon:yes gene_type:complete